MKYADSNAHGTEILRHRPLDLKFKLWNEMCASCAIISLLTVAAFLSRSHPPFRFSKNHHHQVPECRWLCQHYQWDLCLSETVSDFVINKNIEEAPGGPYWYGFGWTNQIHITRWKFLRIPLIANSMWIVSPHLVDKHENFSMAVIWMDKGRLPTFIPVACKLQLMSIIQEDWQLLDITCVPKGGGFLSRSIQWSRQDKLESLKNCKDAYYIA